MIRQQILVEAALDYRYLLDRGYPRSESLSIVSRRYKLSQIERMALYRGVHRSAEVWSILTKLVNPRSTSLNTIVLDMYNTLITIVAALRGQPLILSDDCLVRDVRGSKLHPSDYPVLHDAMKLLAAEIAHMNPKHVVIVAESQISHSAEQAISLCREVESRGIACSKIVTPTVDSTILRLSHNANVVITTDTVIALKASQLYPLTTLATRRAHIVPVIDFATVLRSPCKPFVNNLV